MGKREHSPSSPNEKKRYRMKPDLTKEPIVIDDSDDDDISDILVQIKQQEESERLAKQLQEEWSSAGTSSNAIIVDDEDDDEALARRLAKEWEEDDMNLSYALDEAEEVSKNWDQSEPQNPPNKFALEAGTPNEILSHHRTVFTVERLCTKCGKNVPSPRGYVMLSGDKISPALGLLLHAPCSSCKTNHCRGCFKPHPCSASCEGKVKNATCTVDSCCAEVRAIAIFETLGALDRQYISEKANSHSRAAAIAGGRKKTSSSVGPGGTGYGSDRSHSYRGGRRGNFLNEVNQEAILSEALAAKWEVLMTHALQTITALLPSPYSESAQVFDMLPHPSIGQLLSMSKLPNLLGDLLRNDSVTDWISRSEVYYAMLALLRRMFDCELTLKVLLEPRFVMDKGQGIEPWMWEESEVEWEKDSGGMLEHAPPLYDYFKKLSKQSEAFLAGASHLMESEDTDPEETIKATSLCGDIIATRDDVERAISVLSIAPNMADAGSSDTQTKGKEKDTSVTLEKAYSQACERLGFKHVPLDVSDITGKGNGKGGMYPTFNYAPELTSTRNATRIPKNRLHLVKELAVLATSLPPGIWMRVDEVRNDTIKILIAGPDGTPYAGGLFEFDCFMPIDYPAVPPQMHLRTTGGGLVRFNPNLYNDGKVCLSLLGTWPGSPEEQWRPYKSTLLQVLVSIQSMILIDLPYFNEPGYGKANPSLNASVMYNRNIALQTTRWAIVAWLSDENRDGVWGEVIASHFTIRKEKIRKQLHDWATQDPQMHAYSGTTYSRYAYSSYADFGGKYQSMIPQLPGVTPLAQGMDLIKEFDSRLIAVEKWWTEER
ncbi:hypothetical protein BDP27DRAFT_1443929 [Rhodocollybia butyracea]|uniref:UBC core domain-containing protein n=1 Tax=Rhodocollybia butyracea TaxID=206335 RepID=A0A9P5Q3W9_9AGAR|nr:hypothetical protein BDP27DRAFT_1443929 [Rhodocollybia butyracea]